MKNPIRALHGKHTLNKHFNQYAIRIIHELLLIQCVIIHLPQIKYHFFVIQLQ
jgi:hypothetical protein